MLLKSSNIEISALYFLSTFRFVKHVETLMYTEVNFTRWEHERSSQ